MNTLTRKILALFAGIALLFALSACSDPGIEQRDVDSAAVKKLQTGTSLEKTQLTERLKRQNVSTKVGYVYLLNFGKPFGYYVIKGKVSNAGSQLAPEQELYASSYGATGLDGPQDDGTYGTGDPGIFFFTSSGTMVETSIDYIYTDQPMDLDVPVLGK